MKDLKWYKSSYSSANGQCTMCARLPGGGMAVQDSKNPDGGTLVFTTATWRAFIEGAKTGRFA